MYNGQPTRITSWQDQKDGTFRVKRRVQKFWRTATPGKLLLTGCPPQIKRRCIRVNGQELALLAVVGIGWVLALYHQSCKLIEANNKKD